MFEGFEGFADDRSVTSLPNLALIVEPLPAGPQPGVYLHGVDNTPSGRKQLANFPGNCCITNAYQFGDLSIRVDPNLRAFAFWNGDPQGNAVLRIYDRSNVLIGTVTAGTNTGAFPSFSDSFAGFLSTEPVGRLEFEGSSGDGWNHYDDFHASFVPEPANFSLLLAAGIALLCLRWRSVQ